MHPANLNVVPGVLPKGMAITDSVNVVAGVAILIFVFVEPEGEVPSASSISCCRVSVSVRVMLGHHNHQAKRAS